MGKGDIKTKRGKITNGTFGKLRKHKTDSDKTRQNTEENNPPKK